LLCRAPQLVLIVLKFDVGVVVHLCIFNHDVTITETL